MDIEAELSELNKLESNGFIGLVRMDYSTYLKNAAQFADQGVRVDLPKWINEEEEQRAQQLDTVWQLQFLSWQIPHWYMASSLESLLAYVKTLCTIE